MQLESHNVHKAYSRSHLYIHDLLHRPSNRKENWWDSIKKIVISLKFMVHVANMRETDKQGAEKLWTVLNPSPLPGSFVLHQGSLVYHHHFVKMAHRKE